MHFPLTILALLGPLAALADPSSPITLEKRVVSPDNTCGTRLAGAGKGYTCGEQYPCCGSNVWCGSEDAYCLNNMGCQKSYSLTSSSCGDPVDGSTVTQDQTFTLPPVSQTVTVTAP